MAPIQAKLEHDSSHGRSRAGSRQLVEHGDDSLVTDVLYSARKHAEGEHFAIDVHALFGWIHQSKGTSLLVLGETRCEREVIANGDFVGILERASSSRSSRCIQ
jgi:hypothetical protein